MKGNKSNYNLSGKTLPSEFFKLPFLEGLFLGMYMMLNFFSFLPVKNTTQEKSAFFGKYTQTGGNKLVGNIPEDFDFRTLKLLWLRKFLIDN